ncbi:DUF5946 family protein [Brevundimonas sp.]|uniref:DUF5946 family protein n=1 Tax=Brevundimonas sp. TaxID=1871086 RepID=UPI002737D43E|nr:DUF5946 family protein [Brevundimonas sp.]MDP3802358.1 DUF5946 family protein [Brevundimonas sp.]
MAGPADIAVCPGCGSRLPAVEGPVHAYMTSSPACWAAFNTVMAREYSDPGLMAVHRLSVDAWAVQHPGDGSRRAIQSVGLHLARLMVQLDQGLEGEAANAAMLAFAARKAELPELPPRPVYALTVADVVGAEAPEAHAAAVRRWAEAVWADWSDCHDFIRRWAHQG